MRYPIVCVIRGALLLLLCLNTFSRVHAGEVTVASDGSGQFKSVQEAIMAGHPTNPTNWWTVRIKPGTYKELIYVQRERGYLRLVGENPEKTVITFDLNANLHGRDGKPIGTFRTATALIDADNVVAENITFENSAGPVGQALAVRLDGDRLVFRNCRFLGWQDTILANRGRHYFENCYIAGHVDFIFGAATAWFEHCRIQCLRDGYITAPSTPETQPFGFVFNDCDITGASPEARTFLGRPWRAFGSSIFLNTQMSEVVRPAGWDNWRDPAREKTTRFGEYNNTGPGAALEARVKWSRRLSESEAGDVTVEKVLGGRENWNPLATVAAATNSAYLDESIFLFTSFREEGPPGLRFVYSYDGYHWSNVPGLFLQPNAGPSRLMRDPSLLRGPDGTYHLVWTTGWRGDHGFGYATSRDLTHWSDQRFIPVMAHEPSAVNVWAPELYYDDTQQQFIICWASTIPGRFPDHLEAPTNNHRMYFTTTRDFKTFAPAKLFLDPGFSVIDCAILKDAGRYVLLLKDNTRPQRNLRVAFGQSPLGPWGDVSEPFTEKFTEGPTAIKAGGEWIIYYDAYQAKRYGAVRTRDFKTFTNITDEVVFPAGHKHGTVVKVNRHRLNKLLTAGAAQAYASRLPFGATLPATEVKARLLSIEQVANRGPFKPDWDNIVGRFKTPSWYQDAKLGIFIHWGAYSVPAFGSEWYPRKMYVTNTPEYAHHVSVYGSPASFGYKDFLDRFKAEKFDPREWARLFKDAGAKYVIPVAEHHDGFPMYDCTLTDWSAAKRGPHRDLIGDLADAVRKEGLVFGASSHRAEHWWFFDNGLRIDSDIHDPRYASLYGPAANQTLADNQSVVPDQPFLEDWLLRSCELVDKYRPQVVYFDWWICQPAFQPYLKQFAAYYYNRGVEWKKAVAINFKHWEGESLPEGAGVLDIERGQLAEIRHDFWQNCNSVARTSWGYITNQQYKAIGKIIDDFVDIVSKNGALLLNIGPRADGTIPEHEQQMLRDLGGWLKINGKAIYESRPWKIYGEGPTVVSGGAFTDMNRGEFTSEDFRFTTRGDTLYALALAWPQNRRLTIKSLAQGSTLVKGAIKDVRLLGYTGRLEWRQTPEGLIADLPAKPPCDYAVTLRIKGL